MQIRILKRLITVALLAPLAGCMGVDSHDRQEPARLSAEQLGKQLFFDPNLSSPAGQSCAICHAPQHGFTDPDKSRPVSNGVHGERFGNRNTPTLAYAAFSPVFHFDQEESLYVGGQFHDGRAATLEEQLAGPLMNPLEMNNASRDEVVEKLRRLGYLSRFEQIFGDGALKDTDTGWKHLTRAITAYERSREVSPFSTKYDDYLAGEAELSEQELRGLKLFEAEDKGNCAACHPSARAEDGTPPLFTDFTYDNLGVPANPDSPFLGMGKAFNPDGKSYVDRGLGVTTDSRDEDGKFKVPTLRNIAVSGPYMHNGVFATLRDVVDFYNSRDVDNKWPAPEVADNVNTDELGDLKLTEQEVDDIVAFLKTLTDGYQPEK